jgi:hypothetical protein
MINKILISAMLFGVLNWVAVAQAPVNGVQGTPTTISTNTGSVAAQVPKQSPDMASAPKFSPATDSTFWVIFGAMSLVILAGITVFARVLKSDRDWSLADAMSGADGKPSTSRIIAFLGFLVMIAIILGIGYSSIWVFLKTGQLPSLSGASAFLAACAGLFAPYFANQLGLAIGGPSSSPQNVAPVVVQSSTPSFSLSPTGVPSTSFGAPVRPGGI